MAKRDRSRAAEALKHRLYVSGWVLSGVLVSIRNGTYKADVVIHRINGIPVGVAVGHEFGARNSSRRPWDYDVMVFVRKKHRRKGIGTILINRLIKNRDRDRVYCEVGIDVSKNFWVKNGLRTY